jgi:hypothetical protein
MPKSKLDKKINIDEKNWAITLVRIGPHHAEIIIEGSGSCLAGFSKAYLVNNHPVEEDLWQEYDGKDWIIAIHLTGSGSECYPNFLSDSMNEKPAVLINNLTGKEIKYDAKTQTYSIEPKEVCNMLIVVQSEKKDPPTFSITGYESVFSQGIMNTIDSFFSPRGRGLSNTHNCISWAKKMLAYTSLYEQFPRYDNGLLFTSTRQYTDTDKTTCLTM